MYVREENLESLTWLAGEVMLSCDTETTGLEPYQGDSLFSIILGTKDEAFYFDFQVSQETSEVFKHFLWRIFNRPKTWVFHNAKFDMAFLRKEWLDISRFSTIYDCHTLAMLVDNQTPDLSLDALADKYLDERKDDRVKMYAKAHKCGFDKVPLDIIVPYAEKDAILTWRLGDYLLNRIAQMNVQSPASWPKVSAPAMLHTHMTRDVFEMISRGVKIDRLYCQDALIHFQSEMEAGRVEFERITGRPFKVSSKVFSEVLDTSKAGTTKNGGLSFNKDVLKGMAGDPIAEAVSRYKNAKAKFNYYNSFLKLADPKDFLHSNLNECGAETLRFTSSGPNLQNMKRPEEGEAEEIFPVRRAIIPDSEDYCLVPIDYSQQEMRLMLDRAKADKLIDAILSGTDVHKATAELAGISRQEAKSVNFGIIYGQGIPALAAKLGVTREKAEDIQNSLFRAEPKIKKFIDDVRKTARERGFVFGWDGTRYHIPRIAGKDMSYLMVNHLIQGGSAAITKVALKNCVEFLRPFNSRIILPIHDELVFNIHKSELHLVPELKRIMEEAYPYKRLPMEAEVSHSWASLYDKVKGLPIPRS